MLMYIADKNGKMREITTADLRDNSRLQRIYNQATSASIRVVSRNESNSNRTERPKVVRTSTPAKTVLTTRSTTPVVTSQIVAQRFHQNWLAKFPTDTYNNGSVNLDDSLTSLNWLQNFNVTNLTSSAAPTQGFVSKDSQVNPNAILNQRLCSTRFMSPPKQCYNKPDYKRNPSAKPPYSYATLICMAMQKTSMKKMALSSIYNWIKDNYSYYRTADPSWQNSIRHNLSLNKWFEKVPRRNDEPGKGGFWRINPEYADKIENGVLRKRQYGSDGFSLGQMPPLKRIKREAEDDSHSFSQSSNDSKEDTSNPFMNFNVLPSDDECDVVSGDINWSTILTQDITVDGRTFQTEDLLDEEMSASPLDDSNPPSESNSDDFGLDELLSQTDLVKELALDFATNDPLDLTVNGESLRAPDTWNDEKDLTEGSFSVTDSVSADSGLHTPTALSPAHDTDSMSRGSHALPSTFHIDHLFDFDNLPDPDL